MSQASFVLLAVALWLASGALHAQPLDVPPKLPAAGSATSVLAPAPAPASPAAPPRSPAPAAPVADGIGPIIEADGVADLPSAREVTPQTRIEQRRQGNRVVEITVTPAGATRSYTIVNREGQRPNSVQELSSGLSTPRFFKFEF